MLEAGHDLAYGAVRALFKPLLDKQIAIRHEGIPHVPGAGPAVLVANHRSVVDPFVIGAILSRPVHFIAAAWMGLIPGLREILAGLGILVLPPADRAGGLLRLGREQLLRGALLGIFPEGEPPTLTRVSPDALLPFRRGAARLILACGIPDLRAVPTAIVAGRERVAIRIPGEWLGRLEPGNPLYRTRSLEIMAYDAVTVRFGRPIVFDFPPGLAGAARDRSIASITAHLERAVGSLLAGG